MKGKLDARVVAVLENLLNNRNVILHALTCTVSGAKLPKKDDAAMTKKQRFLNRCLQ